MHAPKRILTGHLSDGGSMEPLGDGLQLVGFLVVTAMVLASLVAVAIGITVFLYMTDRKIVIFKKRSSSHELGRKPENIPAEAQS